MAALFATASYGQSSRATLSGLVTDPTGSAVANANVTLLSTNTNVARDTTSNGSGLYRFDAVDPGTYTVSITFPGFRTAKTAPFDLAAAQVGAVDVKLELGETTNTVEVSAEGATLQTESAVRGATIESKSITELPFSSRNPVSLALTLPGVSSNRYGTGVATFAVNGTRGRSNNFQIDGTENNDISVAGQAFQIKNPDAVEQVSVQTSNYDSEYGRAGGAVVNVITKGGSNQFHGSLGYLLDVTNDDAITNTQGLNTAVQQRGSPLPGTDQWFFGTFGGPIIKNKTFFFGSYLQERTLSSGSTTANVPSAAGLATLNSLFPTGTNKNVDLYRSIIAGTVANSQFTSVLLGAGRPAVEFGTGTITYPNKNIEDTPTIRIDHRISDKDLLSGRFLYDNQTVATASVSFNGFNTSQKNRYQNAQAAETHVFSPSLTNELRLAYNRITLDFPVDSANALGQTLPNYTIAGVTGFGIATNLPQGRIANNYGVQDTVTWVRGNHSLRAGIDLLDQRSRQFAPIVQRGGLTYSAGGGYSGFANFVDDFGGSGGTAQRDFGSPAYYPKLFRQAYFAQDRWRVNSNLTVSYGVRYEYFGLPVNSLKTPAFTGLFNVNTSNFTGPFNQPNAVDGDKNNFSPSIGMAYSPEMSEGLLGWMFGNKKSVIRSGYNIGYDSFFNNIASNAATSAPNIVSTLFTSAVTSTDARGAANFSTRLPLVARSLTPADSQVLVSKNLVNPYYQHWNFSIQRELPKSVIVEIGYVGTKGTKLFAQEDLNPLVPAQYRINPTGVIPPYGLTGRYDPLQGARSIRTNDGSSTYHAAQVQVSRRFNSGVVFSGSYTWSKLIDFSSDVFAANNTPAISEIPTIFGGQNNERAVSLYDRPHRAVFTYVYALPFFRNQTGLLARTIGGWELSGITTFESGVPLTILNGLDSDGFSGSGSDRPDFNPLGQKNVRAVPNASGTGYVNPDNGNAPIDPSTAQYIVVAANSGRSGNLGRNTYRTPGTADYDMTLVKRVKILERLNLEFRAEAYNVFNHPQLGSGSISPFSPGGGTLTSSVSGASSGRFLNQYLLDGGGRVLRYQLKINF